MNRHTLPLLVLVAALGAAGSSVAQDQGVSGDLERTSKTTATEKLDYAQQATSEMRDAVKAVTRLYDAAKRSGEEQQEGCINERLTQIRALTQVSEMAEVRMKEALATAEEDLAAHEFRKIAVALSKSRQLAIEAQACQEDSGLRSGETTVVVNGGIQGPNTDTETLVFDVFAIGLGVDPPDQSGF